MDYLTWWVKKNFAKDPVIILPMFALAAMVTFIGFLIHPIIGATLAIIVLGIFGTLTYIMLSTAFKKSYEDYKRDTNRS